MQLALIGHRNAKRAIRSSGCHGETQNSPVRSNHALECFRCNARSKAQFDPRMQAVPANFGRDLDAESTDDAVPLHPPDTLRDGVRTKRDLPGQGCKTSPGVHEQFAQQNRIDIVDFQRKSLLSEQKREFI